jgi:aerotaxis receptor
MKMNLPVTSTEYVIEDTDSIVSKTDHKGIITYVNETFLRISGFTKDELIGSSHNIVRHPGMPPEAFKDLWISLKAGRPWTGMVKNRRKNGDFYWVLANVTPIYENGKVAGYMSVRTKPSRNQVNEAEDVYRSIREGKAHGIAIRNGRAVRAGLIGKLAAVREMNLGLRIGISMSLLAFLILALGVAGFYAQANTALQYWIAGIAAAGMLTCLAFWFLLHSTIVQPLKDAVAGARILTGGDLSGKFKTSRDDDMGQLMRALQQMNVNLRSIIGDVRANIEVISHATHEIAQGNTELSSRTEQQASSLEETASSMEQMTATVKQNAGNAKQANLLAVNASNIAVKGGHVVGEVVQTMASISDSSKKIVDIISVIEGIAFQTNILALNAAVEAARAGEQGRGFAVVAGEVRRLAQRSASAAKEIKELIGNSVEKVNIGSRQVDLAGETMTEIVQAVKRVTDIMSEISSASSEQSMGIEQVNQAIMQMDDVTQQNAALVEEAAAAAESMHDQATNLMEAVSIFRLESTAEYTHAVIAEPATAPHSASSASVIPIKLARPVKLPKPARKVRKQVGSAVDIEGEWNEF